MLNTEYADQIYDFIWRYVTTHEELPSRQQIADALDVDKDDVSICIYVLRHLGRICPTTLLPTAYAAWWRENVRREQRWTVKPVIPLRQVLEKQLPLPID